MSQTSQPKYVIDTCSLTQMRRVYPRSVFPGVWQKITELADSGIIVSCEDVFEELKMQEFDELLLWALEREHIFIPLDEETQIQATLILSTYSNLIDIKKKKSSADPFVIALAITKNCTVVTEEQPSRWTTQIQNTRCVQPLWCEVY